MSSSKTNHFSSPSLALMEQEEEAEEEERPTCGHHIARKLNFNAPLLTTRRPAGGATGLHVSGSRWKVTSTSERVPFSWEQAPGKPKEYVERCDTAADDGSTTPRPTLPPSWWRPPIRTSTTSIELGSSRHLHRHPNHRRSNGNGGKDEEEDEDGDSSGGYVLSDAVEVFSLSEAIDIVEKAEKDHKFSDEVKLKQLKYEEEREEERSNDYKQSSNFMMERFLPDATALAASSALNHHAYSWSYRNTGCNSPQPVAQPFSPPKGCGLDILFPWRTKHQICGVKSPVRHGSLSLGSKASSKQKKQH